MSKISFHFLWIVQVCCFSIASCQITSQTLTYQEKITQIDTNIKKLTNLKNLELAKAARAQDQGDRLQFNSNNISDARRYWQEAETSREIADRYQLEINKLNAQKAAIQKEHGIETPIDNSSAALSFGYFEQNFLIE